MKRIRNQSGSIDLILIAVVFILAAGLGGYVYFQQQQAKKADAAAGTGVTVASHPKAKATTTTSTLKSTPVIASTCQSLTNIPAITSGWKTYTSSKYGYSISYPAPWNVSPSGGSVDKLSILDSLEFTPPGNQGSQYGINVTQQSLDSAIANWKADINTRNANGGLSGGPKFTILNDTPCTYDDHPAVEIVSEQNEGSAGITYDIELDVSVNGYLYDFSTNFAYTTSTLTNSTDARIGDVLSVVESLRFN